MFLSVGIGPFHSPSSVMVARCPGHLLQGVNGGAGWAVRRVYSLFVH